ncbi:porin family protein [Bacteroidota bacterium]
MKKLTKITILLIFVAFATNSYAQKFGIKTGINIASVSVKDDDEDISDEIYSKVGLQLGPVVEFPMGDLLSLETGLIFSNKGARDEARFADATIISLNYFEMPVNLRIGFDAGPMKIYGNFGPYVGIAISGRYEDEKFEIGNDEDEDDIKRTDIGLNIGAGAGIRGFEFGLNYGTSLTSIAPQTVNGFKVKNNVFSIVFAYKFGKDYY